MRPPRWTEPPRSTTRPIIAAVCRAAGIDFGELIARNARMPNVVQARRATVYLLRELTGISYPRIAVLLGRAPAGHSSMHERYTAARWLVKRGDVEFINLLDASREALEKETELCE